MNVTSSISPPPNAGTAQPLRVLVVDDEELARMRLKSLVVECGEPSAVVVGEAANAAQALVWLTTRQCDLVLLDVQMPGRDGTQLAAELRLRNPPPAVVFVTAHAEHALKAFDLEAVDYLTKPVKRERLQAALRRVAQRLAVAPGAAPAEAARSEADEGRPRTASGTRCRRPTRSSSSPTVAAWCGCRRPMCST